MMHEICFLLFFLPFPAPHTQTKEGEDDNENSRNRSTNGHHYHLAVDIALPTVKVALALAIFLGVLDLANASSVTKVLGTCLAITTHFCLIVLETIPITGQTLARK